MSGMDFGVVQAEIDSGIQKVSSREELEAFRLKYLGRRGMIAQLTASIAALRQEDRQEFGRQTNALKNKIIALINEKQGSLAQTKAQEHPAATVDITMPGIAEGLGFLHPITRITDEACAIFMRMGFTVMEGPEVETEYNNFTGLNIPLEHPSRDVFDTFYLKDCDKLLLRSHTSPVQIRAMRAHKPPLAIVVPGRVYRPDAVDASHSFMFHQIEGFMLDRDIKFSDLKGTLEIFIQNVFAKDIKMRFRPHFFPFTEPSAEVDISCIICKGKGCSVCGRKGWLEILGCGMIHPNVLQNVGFNSKKYRGFAFGLGVERIAMLKYGINDIRLFFENDLRFLKQF